MRTDQTVIGQRRHWNLVKKLGEGDAGEVYQVESMLEGLTAILKRPRKSSFFSEVLRQADQIKNEGSILEGLSNISIPNQDIHLSIPKLLDQNLPEFGLGEHTFIIIEQAAGLDLKLLGQILHFGLAEEMKVPASSEIQLFIDQWSQYSEFPEQLLTRILYGIIGFLETIHTIESRDEKNKIFGFLWNDVKPEHIYWDPMHTRVTMIDWGNSQLLEADGNTSDRKFSRMDDFYQYIHEMGRFLSEVNPGLCSRLEWPQEVSPGTTFDDCVQPLKERLATSYEIVQDQLRVLRKEEASLFDLSRPEQEHFSQINELHGRLAAFGEIPDIPSEISFLSRGALISASEYRLDMFQQVCEKAAQLPTSSSNKWRLLIEIAGIARQPHPNSAEQIQATFSNALAAGVADDWPSLLWELFKFIDVGPYPAWWDLVSHKVRQVALSMDQEDLPPSAVVSRLFSTLQTAILQKDENHQDSVSEGEERPTFLGTNEDLLRIFREEVVRKWKEVEPAPPNSGIDYRAIDGMVADLESLMPGTRDKLEKVLSQPKAQVEAVLSAWNQKDFELTRRGLRMILIWDPDRCRLLTAERAIEAAPRWLSLVHNGAGKDKPFYDYLTSVELAGRNLRNQVGPAQWLDAILEALKRLRKGTRSADLLIEYPEILHEIPWLNEYRSREILSLPRTRPLKVERDPTTPYQPTTVTGVVESRLGLDKDLHLGETLDTWLPEAVGSSARVFAGYLRIPSGSTKTYAFKIMRPDRVEYALPLFKEEIQILTMLRDVQGTTPLVECGLLRIKDGLVFPSEASQDSAAQLQGELIRYGIEEIQNYLTSIERYLASGWLPYLALVKRNHENNLICYCDAGYTHGWFLPLRESLLLGIQICDILQSAHDRNIAYRDHKILHYYWNPESHGVAVIDWNIAKRVPQGLSEAEKQFDIVQFGARALHHILTGRPVQGSLPLGPNRPEDIEGASTRYPVNWTYDDERLPNQLKNILEQILNQGYTQVRDIRKDLVALYSQFSSTAQEPGNI